MLFYKKETLGLGDGFLLAGISINFNGMLTLSTLYIGIILAGIYSLILIAFTSKTRHSYIPWAISCQWFFYIVFLILFNIFMKGLLWSKVYHLGFFFVQRYALILFYLFINVVKQHILVLCY